MVRCAVVGASGYSGAELVGLLARHPGVELVRVQADGSAGERWEHLHRWGEALFRGELEPCDPERLSGLDVVFLALPHGVSAATAARLRGRVGLVVDLSGDLRFPDPAVWELWHDGAHPAPELAGAAVYGLPELFGDVLPGADLVACAGCYATAAQLAAAPALARGGPEPARVTISAVSGTTGAGRKAALELAFSEVAGDVRAYRVGRHPHAPEIAQGLRRHAGRDVAVTFVPHLAPLRRGILATVVIEGDRRADPEALQESYARAYAAAPFVRVRAAGELPRVADVAHTPFCDLAVTVDRLSGAAVAVAALDNLLKGAASQAVQVMNLVLGLPETTGLLPAPVPEVVLG